MNSGDILNFTSNLSNDNANENLLTVLSNNDVPNLFSQIVPPNSSNGNTLSFHWDTGHDAFVPDADPGVYHFTITSNDQNACSPGIGVFTFTIIVICPTCPICIDYEDRDPASNPLPPLTKAAKCIVAGETAQVSGGSDQIIFQAGESITLGSYFDSGTNLVAEITPTTCVTDCNDCCVDWGGFTYDQIGEVADGYQFYYMSFEDDDPTNDIFQVTDVMHPFCAYGAMGYHLLIKRPQGGIIYESEWHPDQCCSFQSSAIENPIPHASIWWDGYTENTFGHTVHPNPGTYYYFLWLYGCDGAEDFMHGDIKIDVSTPSGMATAPSNGTAQMSSEELQLAQSSTEQQAVLASIAQSVELVPNPAVSTVTIQGLTTNETVSVQIFSETGVVLTKKEQANQRQFDVSKLASGTYYCRIYTQNHYIVKKFVKL